MAEARTQETISADLAEEARLIRQRNEARHQAGIAERNAAIHRAVEAALVVQLRAVQHRLYGGGMG